MHFYSGLLMYFCSGVDTPAYLVTCANGTRMEHWFHCGKRHRADGPAYVETRTDGARIETWYEDGKVLREEHFVALIPTAAIQGAPRSPAP
jgi:hypothetical protein